MSDRYAHAAEILAKHLPPELVPHAAFTVAAHLGHPYTHPEAAAIAVVKALTSVLPEPYASAAGLAQAVGAAVADAWARRVVEVEAGSVTVTDHRG